MKTAPTATQEPRIFSMIKAKLFDRAPDAMLVVDDDGVIVLTNDQADVLFGYPEESLAGQHLSVLIPERFRKAHHAFQHSYTLNPHYRAMGSDLEIVALKHDGTELPVEISLSPLTMNEHDTVTVASIRDISERKESDRKRQTQLSEREAELERLISQAARTVQLARYDSDEYHRALAHYTLLVRHRVANPLQVIKGMARTLHQLDDELDKQTRLEMLEHIERAAQRLEEVTIFIPEPNAAEEAELHPKPFDE